MAQVQTYDDQRPGVPTVAAAPRRGPRRRWLLFSALTCLLVCVLGAAVSLVAAVLVGAHAVALNLPAGTVIALGTARQGEVVVPAGAPTVHRPVGAARTVVDISPARVAAPGGAIPAGQVVVVRWPDTAPQQAAVDTGLTVDQVKAATHLPGYARVSGALGSGCGLLAGVLLIVWALARVVDARTGYPQYPPVAPAGWYPTRGGGWLWWTGSRWDNPGRRLDIPWLGAEGAVSPWTGAEGSEEEGP